MFTAHNESRSCLTAGKLEDPPQFTRTSQESRLSVHELDCHASTRPPAEVCVHVLLMSVCVFCCLCLCSCLCVGWSDHIALIMELLGKVPRKVIAAGKYSREFFSKKGNRAPNLQVYWTKQDRTPSNPLPKSHIKLIKKRNITWLV